MPYCKADDLARLSTLADGLLLQTTVRNADFLDRSRKRLIMGGFLDERWQVGDDMWHSMGTALYDVARGVSEEARTIHRRRQLDWELNTRIKLFKLTAILSDMISTLGEQRVNVILLMMARHYCEARYGAVWITDAHIQRIGINTLDVSFTFD